MGYIGGDGASGGCYTRNDMYKPDRYTDIVWEEGGCNAETNGRGMGGRPGPVK